MMGCIVNVATGRHYGRGQRRLSAACNRHAMAMWRDELPAGCPSHAEVPYAFKAFALASAAARGHKLLLWCDASILPIAPLEPLFDRIERDGYWISRNGWSNGEWTADSAYPDLGVSREENWKIQHVIATAWGVSVRHPIGYLVLAEYLRLAKTRAFCGPWRNRNHPDSAKLPPEQSAPCGPPEVRGHRHDQTALSVIAWKLSLSLTDPPNVLAYKGGETDKTILVADGSYA